MGKGKIRTVCVCTVSIRSRKTKKRKSILNRESIFAKGGGGRLAHFLENSCRFSSKKPERGHFRSGWNAGSFPKIVLSAFRSLPSFLFGLSFSAFTFPQPHADRSLPDTVPASRWRRTARQARSVGGTFPVHHPASRKDFGK